MHLRNAKKILLPGVSVGDSFEKTSKRVGQEHRDNELHWRRDMEVSSAARLLSSALEGRLTLIRRCPKFRRHIGEG